MVHNIELRPGKGGQLARAASPATVVALILSDVDIDLLWLDYDADFPSRLNRIGSFHTFDLERHSL